MSDLNIVNQSLTPKIRKTVDEQTKNKQTSVVKQKSSNNASTYVMTGLGAWALSVWGFWQSKKERSQIF